MRNCLKCSEFDSFEKWCNLHNRHVSPSDSCNAADINGSSLIGESCASCGYFSQSGVTGSGGYRRYHRTATQSGNGCDRFDSALPASGGHSGGYNLGGQAASSSDDPGIFGIIIFAVMMFGLAGAIYDLVKNYVHIIGPIIIMLITIVVVFFFWPMDEDLKTKREKSASQDDIKDKKL